MAIATGATLWGTYAEAAALGTDTLLRITDADDTGPTPEGRALRDQFVEWGPTARQATDRLRHGSSILQMPAPPSQIDARAPETPNIYTDGAAKLPQSKRTASSGAGICIVS